MECPDCKSVVCQECGCCKCLEQTLEQTWISTEDRLPGKNKFVKVKDQYLETTAKFIEWQDGAVGYYFCCDESAISSDRKWTHWMPLPEPPKE